MRRRLYVVLPDLASARQTANDLLLARIEDRHMHFLARRDLALGELHAAGVLQKTDLRRAFFLWCCARWSAWCSAPGAPR